MTDFINPALEVDRGPHPPTTVKAYPKKMRQRIRRRMKRSSGLNRRWIGMLQSGRTITPDVPGAHRLLIFLDGEPQDMVTAFNIRERWVEKIQRYSDGEIAMDGEHAAIEHLTGRVSVKMIREDP